MKKPGIPNGKTIDTAHEIVINLRNKYCGDILVRYKTKKIEDSEIKMEETFENC